MFSGKNRNETNIIYKITRKTEAVHRCMAIWLASQLARRPDIKTPASDVTCQRSWHKISDVHRVKARLTKTIRFDAEPNISYVRDCMTVTLGRSTAPKRTRVYLKKPEAAVSGPQIQAPPVSTTAPPGGSDDTVLPVLLELCGISVRSKLYMSTSVLFINL